jgi:hypothetical protein
MSQIQGSAQALSVVAILVALVGLSSCFPWRHDPDFEAWQRAHHAWSAGHRVDSACAARPRASRQPSGSIGEVREDSATKERCFVMALPQVPWRINGEWVCPGAGLHDEYRRLRALSPESITGIETRGDSAFVATAPCRTVHRRVVLITSK